MRPWLLWSVLLVVATCSVVAPARPAEAHTSLTSSTPPAGAVVVDPVDAVTLVFSQPVSPRQVQLVVTGPDGADVAQGPVEVSGGTVRRSLGAWSGSGDHLLAYRVLAADGHPITGQVPFSVALPEGVTDPTATTVPPDVAEPAQPDGTGVGPVLLVVLGGVAVVLVSGAVRAGRRAGVG